MKCAIKCNVFCGYACMLVLCSCMMGAIMDLLEFQYGPFQELYDGHNDCHGSIRVSVWAIVKSPNHVTIE
jgi:hypothetical protein